MIRWIVTPLLCCASLDLWADTTSMICTWKLWFDDIYERDAFIFNVDETTVFWVNENRELKLIEITEGLIKFDGIPYSRVQIDKSKFKTHIPIKFTLNRITGELRVQSEYAKLNSDSKCVVSEPLL